MVSHFGHLYGIGHVILFGDCYHGHAKSIAFLGLRKWICDAFLVVIRSTWHKNRLPVYQSLQSDSKSTTLCTALDGDDGSCQLSATSAWSRPTAIRLLFRGCVGPFRRMGFTLATRDGILRSQLENNSRQATKNAFSAVVQSTNP